MSFHDKIIKSFSQGWHSRYQIDFQLIFGVLIGHWARWMLIGTHDTHQLTVIFSNEISVPIPVAVWTGVFGFSRGRRPSMKGSERPQITEAKVISLRRQNAKCNHPLLSYRKIRKLYFASGLKFRITLSYIMNTGLSILRLLYIKCLRSK
jgi:hypothetical protein